MGLNLNRWVRDRKRDITDVFDANSQRDQQKRVAQGQPRMYADQQAAPARPVQTPMRVVDNRNFGQKVFDQVNPYDNERTFKQGLPTNNQSFGEQLRRDANTVGVSIARGAGGIVSDTSGLVDAVSPGIGTSRVTQATNRHNERLDQFVKDKGYSSGLYKGAQVPYNAAAFLLPGMAAESLGARAPTIIKGTSTLSKAGRWATSPATLVDVASDVGQSTGFKSAREQDISPKSIAADVGLSYATGGALAGLGAAGKAAKNFINGAEAPQAIKPTVSFKNPDEPSKEPSFLRQEVKQDSKKEVSKAEQDYKAQQSQDRAIRDTAVGRQAQKAADDLRTQQATRLAQADLVDDATFLKRRTALSKAYDKEMGAVESLPEITRKRAADDINAKYEQANRDLEDARAETDALKKLLGDDPNVAPRLQQLTPEQRANQGVPETPEAFKMDGGTPNPTAGADSPIVMSGGGRSNVPDTVKPARTDEQIVFGDAPKFEEKGTSVPQKLSPDKYIRQYITEPITEAKRKVAFKAQTSDNPFARAYARTAQGISRESVVPNAVLQQKRYLRGGVEKGKLVREGIADLGEGIPVESKARVWAALDPEQAKRLGVTVDPATFTPDEKAYFDTLDELTKFYTQGNLERGFIDEKQAANADWFKRGYSVFEEGSDQSKAYNQTKQAILNQYKGRKQVSEDLINEAITDPGYLMAKKAAESHAAWAMSDYGKFLNSEGIASDVKLPGTRQLPNSKLFGEAAGKYVPTNIAEDFTGFEYNNGVINAFNDMITAYDRIGLRQAKKQLLTVFNPAVRGGNQVSNRVFFANMTGINPVQFNRNYVRAGKEISGKGQLYREAVEQGLTGIDITQAEFAKRISQYMEDPGALRQANDWVKSSYSAADDKARVAAYITHRERGLSPEEAARLTQRGFQDYKSVGFFYDMAAKTPLIGNAFVRFAGDAVRIAKNAALDHPLRSVATVAMWSAFVNGMSVASGESTAGQPGDSNLTKAKNLVTGANKSEDQQTREDRFGSPKIPFTDISMTVQTPWGEVNVARFMPFYQLNDVQNAYTRFLPLQESPIGFKDGKPVANGAGFSDPLLGQAAQVLIDKDFRNKSIRDPENTGQFQDPLSGKDQAKNVARFLGVQNLPLGRETDTIGSAVINDRRKQASPDNYEPFKDLYGKERTVPQAVLRSGGIKVEEFGKKQAQEQRDKNAFFDEKAQRDKEIAQLPKGDQEAYKRLTGYDKLREKVPNEFEPGKKRYKKAPVFGWAEDKWKDYVSHPGIYERIRQDKLKDTQKGAPLQPEFDDRLSDTFRKQLIQNKSLPPGEDAEADERMYSNPEWDTYQKLKDEYTARAKQYYPDNGSDYVDELVKNQDSKFPEKPSAKKAYDEAYAKYDKGQGPKPAFTDEIAAAKEKYSTDKFNWTNNARRARGLPPLSRDVWDNVTFGFESDEEKVYKELKYGKGYGGYGGYGKGGNKTKTAGDPFKYAIDLNAGGKVVKPNVRVADAPKPKVAKKGGGKPKVTLKRSKV